MATGDGCLTLAVQKLTDLLIQEADFLLGIKDDVVFVKNELNWMRAFLKDAEQKQGSDERIRLWVDEIKTIALFTEDAIDAYRAEAKGKEPSKWKLLTISVSNFLGIADRTNVYEIGKKIVALKERLSIITRRRELYGINNIGSTQETANVESKDRLRDPRRTTSYADEEDFVGFEYEEGLLKKQLSSSELQRSVVALLGMGGLGKTCLARRLYNTKFTNKDTFDLHAWVCVSQELNTEDLIERIIKALKEPTYNELRLLKEMNGYDKERHLHQLLKDKRYLLVIDDMWDEGIWPYLKGVLPDDSNRSRVIITARNGSVVTRHLDRRTYVHKLRRLREDESWELFCKIAFSRQNGTCPRDLEEIGKHLVSLLDGLPLAIIVLGGILSNKDSNEWPAIKMRVWKALEESIHIINLLTLSYNDLSDELKLCFLYLGMFPERCAIDTRKLVNLWIAEDLLPTVSAENYALHRLFESLIHVHLFATCSQAPAQE